MKLECRIISIEYNDGPFYLLKYANKNFVQIQNALVDAKSFIN